MSRPGPRFRPPYNDYGGRGGQRNFGRNDRFPQPNQSSMNGSNGDDGISSSADLFDEQPATGGKPLFPHRHHHLLNDSSHRDRRSNYSQEESKDFIRSDNRGRGGLFNSNSNNSHQNLLSQFSNSPKSSVKSPSEESKLSPGSSAQNYGFDRVRSDSLSSPNIMVPDAKKLSPEEIMEFVRHYRTLECSCCNQFLAFQHRVTGSLVCQPGCDGQASSVAPPLNHGPPSSSVSSSAILLTPTHVANVSRPASIVDQSVVNRKSSFERTEEARPEPQPIKPSFAVPSIAQKEDEGSFRHTSTLHKYDAPQKPDTPPAKRTNDGAHSNGNVRNRDDGYNVAAQSRSSQQSQGAINSKVTHDEVDDVAAQPRYQGVANTANKVAPSKPTYNTVEEDNAPPEPAKSLSASLPKPPARKEIETEDTDNGMRPAEALRKDINPFKPFTGFVPTKVAAASATKTAKSYNKNAEQDYYNEEKTVQPVQKIPQKQQEEVVPEPTPAPAPKPKKPAAASNVLKGKYDWMDCKYSKHLKNGAKVKVSFVWELNKYQVTAQEDEDTVLEFQEEIQKHVKRSKPITRPPVIDEILFAEYQDEYYRGRVTEIKDGKAKLVFVDFGDAEWTADDTELYEPNDELMKHPIYSVLIVLAGVPAVLPKVKAPQSLNKIVFSQLRLELCEEKLNIQPSLDYSGKLWTADKQHLDLSNLVLELVKTVSN